MDKILLFIPMYNCEKQIVRVLKQINNDNVKYFNEVLIINNRSTDNGEEVVKNFIKKSKLNIKFTLLKNDENYGLGGSHKVAFKYCLANDYNYVIVLHGDDQGSIKDIIPYLKSQKYKQADCLLGSRFMDGSKLDGYSKFRTFGNRVYNVLFSVFLNKDIKDLGSGLNMYNMSALDKEYYLKFPDSLAFNCYMLLASDAFDQQIEFFPISWREDDQVSNVKMVSQSLKTLKLLLEYKIKKEKYLLSELRSTSIEDYTAEKVNKER